MNGHAPSYHQYTNRPRWDDYGAPAADGANIWLASEYVGQTCTQAQYTADFTCGGTRVLGRSYFP